MRHLMESESYAMICLIMLRQIHFCIFYIYKMAPFILSVKCQIPYLELGKLNYITDVWIQPNPRFMV